MPPGRLNAMLWMAALSARPLKFLHKTIALCGSLNPDFEVKVRAYEPHLPSPSPSETCAG